MSQPLSTWFAFPALLGLLAVLPPLAVLMLYARHRRGQACAMLAHAGALEKLQPASALPRRWRASCLFLGLVLLILATAGPRWGRVSAPVTGPERALVLVLDVSRSMLAEQPSRQELARRAVGDLAATLSDHGGLRLALVVFAGHAQLAMPLTSDYDHVLDVLGRFDADDLPPSLRPRGNDGPTSGTRVGEALRLAIHALDIETGGDIMLLSDGDDPAGDDEWLQGAEEARRHHIPVHTIGLGNPRQAFTIPFGSGVLEFAGQPVLTRLNEKPLKEIARRTRGVYVPAHTDKLLLGKLLPSILGERPPDVAADAEASLPIWQPRYAWFLTPALLFLALTLIASKPRPEEYDRRAYAAPFNKLLILPLLFGLLSAAPLPSASALLRQGNEAFEALQNKEALELFEQAEDYADDPALVAFNEAAAYYRLKRYGDAALHYQRCLEDPTIPGSRRAWAYFQMGNAYLQDSQAVNRALLEKALAAYRACLLLDGTPLEMRGDARHNLELGRLLWLKTLPNPEDLPNNDEPPPQPKPKNSDPQHPKTKRDDRKPGANASETDEPGNNDSANSGKADTPNKSKNVVSGPLTVLPDDSELVPLSPQETEAHLEDVAGRIARERRHFRRHAVLVPENVKDW